jgi:hypothetical protein
MWKYSSFVITNDLSRDTTIVSDEDVDSFILKRLLFDFGFFSKFANPKKKKKKKNLRYERLGMVNK